MTYDQKISTQVSEMNRLINYDRSKTLLEQKPDSVSDRNLGISRRNARALNMTDKEYEDKMYGKDSLDNIKWNHDLAGYLEIGLTIGGILAVATGVGAPIGAAMLAAGTTIGVADAAAYFVQEKDPYMGSMMLALSLIPGGELVSALGKKAGKEITEQELKKLPALLQKISNNKVLTDLEGELWQRFSKSFVENAPEILKTSARNSLKFLNKHMVSKGLLWTLGTLAKVSGKGLQLVVKIGRIAVSVDLLWTLLAAPEGYRKRMRDKSEFSKIMDMLYDGTLGPTIIDGLYDLWLSLTDSDGNIDKSKEQELIIEIIENSDIDFTDSDIADQIQDSFNDTYDNITFDLIDNRWSNLEQGTKQQTTFNDLLSGDKIAKLGSKGKFVREIQIMLNTLGYDLGESGIDSDFGKVTQDAVIDFQIDYDLDGLDGIVGKETSTKLKSLYDERKG
jgi:hypothetical protein